MEPITVCVRFRPLNERECAMSDQVGQWKHNRNSVDYTVGAQVTGSFTFDNVFGEGISTGEVYEQIGKSIVNASMEGYNGSIFAYGQTSSGKTYTMYGTESAPGIIRLAAEDIYSVIERTPEREYLLQVSMVEIYNENIKDLLGLKPVKIREDYTGKISLDADRRTITSPQEMLRILKEGEARAARCSTNMNECSSRSHTVFRIYVESKLRAEDEDDEDSAVGIASCFQSELNLIDLAGSECAALTGTEGSVRREGAFINKSLLALSSVIEKLSLQAEKKNRGSDFVNYRDSVLTRILQNSLGGNSKTAIVCNVTAAFVHIQQTNSTLGFAARAKKD